MTSQAFLNLSLQALRDECKAHRDALKGSGGVQAKVTRQLIKGYSSCSDRIALAVNLDLIEWAQQERGTVERFRLIGTEAARPNQDALSMADWLATQGGALPRYSALVEAKVAQPLHADEQPAEQEQPAADAAPVAFADDTTDDALAQLLEAGAQRDSEAYAANMAQHTEQTTASLEQQLAAWSTAPRKSKSSSSSSSSSSEPKNPLTITEPVEITLAGTEHKAQLHPNGSVHFQGVTYSKLAKLEKQLTGKSYAKPWENWTYAIEDGSPQLIDLLRKTPTFTNRMGDRFATLTADQLAEKVRSAYAHAAFLRGLLEQRLEQEQKG